MIDIRICLVSLVLLLTIVSPADADASLDVRISALHSSRGQVGCTLYRGPQGFPKDPNAAIQRKWCPITGSTSLCRFDPIPAGTYAVACFHDENGNSKLDTGLFGIPKEGVVVSNRAKGTLGPPSYDDAKFTFNGNATELALPMSY